MPGYSGLDPATRQAIATALQRNQVDRFFDLVLPAGLPPHSYRSALGDAIFGPLPSAVQAVLSDTDTAIATILPTDCGQAGSLPLPTWELPAFRVGLIPDLISASGVVTPTSWGVGGQIRFTLTLDPRVAPDGTVTLAPRRRESSGRRRAGRSSEASPPGRGPGHPPAAVAGRGDRVQRGPDGITVQLGVSPGNPPLPAPAPSLTMSVTSESNRKPAGSGVIEIDNQCVHGRFSYQDYKITMQATFTVAQSNLAPPVSYQWTVAGAAGFLAAAGHSLPSALEP